MPWRCSTGSWPRPRPGAGECRRATVQIWPELMAKYPLGDYKARFEADPRENKRKADASWPSLVAKHGK